MNWKRFLKLDWGKVVITILLIIVFSPKPCGSSGWEAGTSSSCSCYGILKTSPPSGMWDSYTYRCYGICDFTCSEQHPEFILIFMLEFWIETILLILALYLISCFIIWIYDKVKKR